MPDMTPTRSDDQKVADAIRTHAQVQKLGVPEPSLTTDPDPSQLLKNQSLATSEALQFDIVERLAGGGSAYVVSGQVLVPVSVRQQDGDSELTTRGFERLAASPGDPLDDLVWAYSYQGDEADARAAVDGALSTLRENEIPAAHAMVTAQQMVLKSADGPAPTTVQVAPFSAEAAALAEAPDAKVVAVIDTGIDQPSRGDGWLNEVRDRSTGNYDALDLFPATATPGAWPILDYGAGHGTFVAGIIRQVDPQAKIVVYRALDTRGLADEKTVADAMTLAAEKGASVISISSGMLAVNDAHPCPHLQRAVQQIMSRTNPPAIVAAAGNNGDMEKVYPAALEGVVAVAALQAVEEPISNPPPPTAGAEWSSHGDWVDCSAVGEGIVSTFVKGEEDPQFGSDTYPQDSWAVWTGTSFAAPQIAALIAKHCRDHHRTPQEAVMDLFPAAGVPSADGYGKHVLLLAGTPPTPPPPPNP
jgi:thermitase